MLKTGLKVAVTLGLLGVLFHTVDIPTSLRLITQARWPLLFSAVGLVLLDRGIVIVKWLPLLRIQLPNVSAWSAAKAYYGASFAALIMPSAGSDVLRAIVLGRGRKASAEIGASIVVERLLGFVASAALNLMALAVAMRQSVDLTFLAPWALASAVVGVAFLVLPLYAPSVASLTRRVPLLPRLLSHPIVRRFVAGYQAYRQNGRWLLIVGSISLLEQLIPVVVLWLISRAIGTNVSAVMLFVAVPLALFASRLPLSIWGLGVEELSLVYLLGLFNIPAYEAVAISVGGRLVEFIGVSPGAFFWVHTSWASNGVIEGTRSKR